MLASRSCDPATLGFLVPWRLSGLLSGYLPTDTRPQARAKLGKSAIRVFGWGVQEFFGLAGEFIHHALEPLQSGRSRGSEHERMLS